MDLPAIAGFGHIDLTVTDADRSVQWWEEVMGFKLIATSKRDGFKVLNVIHPSGFVVGLVQHEDRVSDRFDERSVGLDHLALRRVVGPQSEAEPTELLQPVGSGGHPPS